MKKSTTLRPLRMDAALLALICFGTRWGLYAFGRDARGLLPLLHPLAVAVWAVTAVAAAWLLPAVWKLQGSERYEDNFAPSVFGALGNLAGAAGIALTVMAGAAPAAGRIGLVWQILGYASVPMLVWAAVCRFRGQRPLFLCRMTVCVFLVIHGVCCYPVWSSDPQLMDYFFPLFAVVALMLFSYQHTAFDARMGNRRLLLGAGLLGAVLCFGAVAGGSWVWLYLGGGIWCLTDLCRLAPKENPKTESE